MASFLAPLPNKMISSTYLIKLQQGYSYLDPLEKLLEEHLTQ